MATRPIIDIEHVYTKFGKRVILDDVVLGFHEGSISSLTGKSGAGKTTLLGIISGLLQPDKGKVYFKGKNILRWGDIRRSRYRNREIGFVFQFFNLLSEMTSFHNIVFPARLSLLGGRGDVDGIANELIDHLGIRNIANHYPGTLSGGERQRVAIARAIINKPRIILADEPTGNLDDASARTIIDLFKKLRDEDNMCIVVVTHDARIVAAADNHYHLEGSRITKVREKKQAKKNPAAKKAVLKKSIKVKKGISKKGKK